MSFEDGRAASRGNDRLKLSRWAERWEREHGGLRCRRRAEHNRRRAAGEWVVDKTAAHRARFRRSGGEVERERVEPPWGDRRIPEAWRMREVVDVAQRRLHERRMWEWVQDTAGPVRARMERDHRAQWAELLRRQESHSEGDEDRHRRERISQCAVERRAFLAGANRAQQLVAPAGSSQSGSWRQRHGLKHSGGRAAFGRLGDHAGRNVSER